MRRHLQFAAAFIFVPPFAGFAIAVLTAVLYGTLGWGMDSERVYHGALQYVAGFIAGWWLCGGDA